MFLGRADERVGSIACKMRKGDGGNRGRAVMNEERKVDRLVLVFAEDFDDGRRLDGNDSFLKQMKQQRFLGRQYRHCWMKQTNEEMKSCGGKLGS